MRVCLVTPFAWSQPHDVNEHVAGVAGGLRALGHEVTVLAPSTRAADLLAGRRALLRGEQADVIAVGPAIPVSRRSQLGVPVGVQANLRLALAQGSFDVVHGFEPGLPSLSYLALRDTDALGVATFVSEKRLGYPPARSQREKLLGRLDALIALSEQTRDAAEERFPGDYRLLSPGVDTDLFSPGPKRKQIVVELRPNEREVARAVLHAVRELSDWEIVLLRTRPLIGRPAIPRDLAARVHLRTAKDAATRAALLNESGDLRPRRRRPAPRDARGCCRGLRDRPAARRARPSRSSPPLRPPASPRTTSCASAKPLRRAPTPRTRRSSTSPASSRRSTTPSGAGAARAARPSRSPTGRGSSPTCTCTPRGRTTAASTRPSSSTTPRPKGSERSPSPTTTSSAARSRPLDYARGRDLIVIPGEEVKTDNQGEVIGLFLEREIPRGLSFGDTIAAIREQGGLVYVPHPFDRLHAIPDPRTLHRHLADIDVLEVYNARLLFEAYNDEALRFARKYNLTMGAGSDAHVLQGVGTGALRMRAFRDPEEFLISLRTAEVLRRPKSLAYLQSLKWVAQVKERVR